LTPIPELALSLLTPQTPRTAPIRYQWNAQTVTALCVWLDPRRGVQELAYHTRLSESQVRRICSGKSARLHQTTLAALTRTAKRVGFVPPEPRQ
jgi:hypothetical protein